MTEQIANDIIEMINEGDLDESLSMILTAITTRQLVHLPEDDNQPVFRVGQKVQVTAKLRPNYLFGSVFEAVKVNPKTVMVYVPNEARYRKYAGSQVRIPKNALKVVE